MARRVKFALAGLGSVSQRGILPHLDLPDAREKIELAAVCDVVEERAKDTAAKYGVAQYFSDFDEMLAKADVEAVGIAGPIPVHYQQVMKALAAGKHVYVQKTMTTTAAEATDIIEARKKAGVKLVASPGQMLNRTQTRIRDLIREGGLGKIYWAFSTNAGRGHENEAFRGGSDALSNVDPTWYYKKGGGPMFDMTVYSLHTLTGILGPVKRVTGVSGIARPVRYWKDKAIDVEMDDNTLALLDFGDATFAVATGQSCPTSSHFGFGRMAFFGTEGAVDVGAPIGGVEINAPKGLQDVMGFAGTSMKVSTSARDIPYVTDQHALIQEPHVYADIAHLAECIVEDREPIPSAEHARHVVEIIEAAYRASETNQSQILTTTF